MKIRALLYARVSTSHHDQNPEIQLRELRAFCKARDWTISEEIIDKLSGATDQRPGLKRIQRLVRSREVDAIVILKLDRLFRSLKHLVMTLDEFQALGVQFVATRDQVGYTTASGRFFVQILGSLAEFEKELLRERTILGLNYARSVGKKLGRPKKRDDEAILKLRAQGLSYSAIQRQLGTSRASIHRAIKLVRKPL